MIVYDPNIFRDLANISNVGLPYPTAHHTPLEMLQEQTRLQDFEEERQRQTCVFEDAQREVARQLAEEENRRAAEALQVKLEKRAPVNKRKKQCAMKMIEERYRKEAQQRQKESSHGRQETPLEEEEQRREKRQKFRNDPPVWERRAPPPPPPLKQRRPIGLSPAQWL